MKSSLKLREGWYDYLVEHDGRRLYGTCSDIETAREGIRKAEEALQHKPINPRRNP